jgi:cysteinyl-tRNA synthetase
MRVQTYPKKTAVFSSGELNSKLGRGSGTLLVEEIEDLLRVRDLARRRGDFGEADEIRLRLTAAGIQISDSPAGTTWASTGKARPDE